jgi:hypothetical protein
MAAWNQDFPPIEILVSCAGRIADRAVDARRWFPDVCVLFVANDFSLFAITPFIHVVSLATDGDVGLLIGKASPTANISIGLMIFFSVCFYGLGRACTPSPLQFSLRVDRRSAKAREFVSPRFFHNGTDRTRDARPDAAVRFSGPRP